MTVVRGVVRAEAAVDVRLLTVDEVAMVLRTTRKAVYALVERQQLPGVCRLGRRVLIRHDALVEFIDHNTARHRQEEKR
jgi:excisionase family DNA binding protein